MIKFTDNAFIGGQYFTPGMIAEFDAKTEADLLINGYAVNIEIDVGGTVDFATTAGHADTADSATTALSAATATTATTAGHATTADSAATATTADTATTAGHADTADTAATASHAATATTATSALSANTAGSADSATTATTAINATNASHAVTADSATSATTAGHATTADSSTTADTATTAVTATSAVSADKAAAVQIAGTSQLATPELGKPKETLAAFAVAKSCVQSWVDERLDFFIIPAGTLGENSILQIEPLWTFTNSAGVKVLRVKISGTIVYSATRTTSAMEAPLIILANRNSLTSQIKPFDSGYVTAGTGAPTTFSIDFSKAVILEITGQRQSTGDTVKLEYYRVEHTLG